MKDDLLLAGAPYTGGCGDLGGDQIVPASLLGKEYIAINGALNGSGDYLFITATENNTQISINGAQVTTLNAGETTSMGMNAPSVYIQSTQPVSVWQLSGIGCELGLTQLPKIRCTGSNIVAFTRSSSNDLYLNIVTPSGSENGFTVNNSSSVLIPSDFSPVPGTSGTRL